MKVCFSGTDVDVCGHGDGILKIWNLSCNGEMQVIASNFVRAFLWFIRYYGYCKNMSTFMHSDLSSHRACEMLNPITSPRK